MIVQRWNLDKEKSLLIKCIAIIEVILGHCGIIECGGSIGVDLFLLISGYGIYLSYKKSEGKKYWRKRISTVYFPYLFCTICFIVLRIVSGKQLTCPQIIISIIGLDFDLNLDPTMWYISFIFVMYYLAWGYFKLSDNKKILGILWCCVFVFVVTACGYKYIIWHKGTIAWAYGLTFLLGILIAENQKNINIFIPLLTITFFITTLLLINIPHEKILKMIFPLVACLSIFFAIGFINTDKLYGMSFAMIIGKQSFYMYLNEALILGLVSSFVQYGGYIHCVLSVCFSFCLAIIMHTLYQLIKNKGSLLFTRIIHD